jgi:carbamoyltransferase
MRYLGVADNHDCGVSIIDLDEDGHFKIVAQINEERLNRIKLTRGLPDQSLSWLEQHLDGGLKSIDKCCWASTHTPISALRLLRSLHQRAIGNSSEFSISLTMYLIYLWAVQRVPGLLVLETGLSGMLLNKALRLRGCQAGVELVDHHRCHAAGAYYSSGFLQALVITIDATGDGIDCSVSIGSDRQLDRIFARGGSEAIGLFYSRATEALGFTPNRHEGKLTGLAAYGKPQPELLKQFATVFSVKGSKIKLKKDHRLFTCAAAQYSRADFASTVQTHLQNQIVAFCRHHLQSTGQRNLVLAGGLFANVRLNQLLYELEEVDQIYIFPNMGDGGLSLGAILHQLKPQPTTFNNLYHGPMIEEASAREALDKHGLSYTKPADMELETAGLLAAKKTVARCQGPLEWGPRALGNRSILYHAGDNKVNDWLNRKLRRTEFMPFAPLTLEEQADACYHNWRRARRAARFMTITLACTEQMRAQCPAVVHVDGTARPQILSAQENPELHRILSYYHELTGIGSIVNTSFNLHEELIVCSAEEAVVAYCQAELDALVLGPYLVRRNSEG